MVSQLLDQQGRATASGFRVSRAPRAATIRWAMIEVNGVRGEVRIRNLSSNGAMIDGIEFGGPAEGMPIDIELIDGELTPARVRWARDQKAGLEFFEAFNLERLAQASAQPHLRKAG